MADVSVSLDLDAQKLYQELQTAQSHVAQFASKTTEQGEKAAKGFSSSFGSLGTNLVQGIAALGIGHSLEEIVHHFSEIQIISQRFGVSTTILQQMAQAAETLHIPLESVAKAFRFLELAREKALINPQGDQANAFKQAAVSVQELQSLDPAQLFIRTGSAAISATDGLKLFGRGFTEARQLAEGLGSGQLQLGTHIVDPADVARIHEADLALTKMKQTLTELGGTLVGTFVKNFQGSLAELVLNMRAVDSEITGVMNAIKRVISANVAAIGDEFGALGKAMKAALKGHFGEAIEDIKNGSKQAADTAAKGLKDAGAEIKKGHEDAKSFHEAAKEAKKEAEEAPESASIKQRPVAIDELEEKADAKEAKKAEKEDEKEAREAEKERKAEIRDDARDQKDTVSQASENRRRARVDQREELNPTGLSLHEMATKGSGAIGAKAREAESEEALAKQLALEGNTRLAGQHQNHAEQLKKDLGLDNKIDRAEAFKDGLDKSEVLRQIQKNTADATANK